MNEKCCWFDETGTRYETDSLSNMKAMLDEFLDEDLREIYTSTRYFHELELAKLELIELGLLTQTKGEEYDQESFYLGAKTMADEVIKRHGQKTLDEMDSEVDTTWKANKPDFSKYKK